MKKLVICAILIGRLGAVPPRAVSNITLEPVDLGVGRPEVDKFRGAIQGEFEQGVFFTTSDFTPDARDASLRRGAVPVILLNGESIVDLMIEKGLGVERVPIYAFYDRPSDLVATDQD